MKKYVCSICGYIYDEAAGYPQAGIALGTKWQELPEGWTCPICGAAKDDFYEQKVIDTSVAPKATTLETPKEEMRELSYGELSAVCSNLAKGCEKQYRAEEAEQFVKLSEYYQSKVPPVDAKQFTDLAALIQQDLESYAQAKSVATSQTDRGALRALVWGEKVTTILSSLLRRYEKQQNALLENTKVYVCDICGFVYIGDEPPEICPVCKVPQLKIRQVQRG